MRISQLNKYCHWDTVIDASFRNKINRSITQKYFNPENSEFILVTGHRKENFGQGEFVKSQLHRF